MDSELRYCADIGMFAIDRPTSSCVHRSPWCAKHCYNKKLYLAFGHGMIPKDKRSEEYWQTLTGDRLSGELDRKKHQTARVRLMTRGEAFKEVVDVYRVADIAASNPNRLFWIPTRAWRNPELRRLIQTELFPIANLRIMASIDPSTDTMEEIQLELDGWSTLFAGDDSETKGRKLCPKTWKGRKGACATCRGGCFSSKRVDVHLKEH